MVEYSVFSPVDIYYSRASCLISFFLSFLFSLRRRGLVNSVWSRGLSIKLNIQFPSFRRTRFETLPHFSDAISATCRRAEITRCSFLYVSLATREIYLDPTGAPIPSVEFLGKVSVYRNRIYAMIRRGFLFNLAQIHLLVLSLDVKQKIADFILLWFLFFFFYLKSWSWLFSEIVLQSWISFSRNFEFKLQVITRILIQIFEVM